jgi:NAD(P)H-dependent flavin oxidoreductase YrpB (nitropropane dioxygenase family)
MPMGWNSFDYDRPGVDKIVNWVLKNAHSGQVFLFHVKAHEATILNYPIQNALTRLMRVEAAKQNCTDFMIMLAGQGFHLCKKLSATQLAKQLQNEIMLMLKNNTGEK